MKVRTEARREAILAVARKIFLESGFERASMSEIARQVGGSKATLYGYFPSKEALFLEAIHAEGRQQLEQTVAQLTNVSTDGLQVALQRLGARYVAFVAAPSTVAAHRMVLAEAGHSEIGALFYEQGPQMGLARTAEMLRTYMDRGELRPCDPMIAACHLLALLSSEVQPRWFYTELPPLKAEECDAMALRAVETFIKGYGADSTAATD